MTMLMLSCKRAAYLIDKKSSVNLSMMETFQLSLHTRMCDVCSSYEKQTKILDVVIHKIQSIQPITKTLPEGSKNKIIKTLEET